MKWFRARNCPASMVYSSCHDRDASRAQFVACWLSPPRKGGPGCGRRHPRAGRHHAVKALVGAMDRVQPGRPAWWPAAAWRPGEHRLSQQRPGQQRQRYQPGWHFPQPPRRSAAVRSRGCQLWPSWVWSPEIFMPHRQLQARISKLPQLVFVSSHGAASTGLAHHAPTIAISCACYRLFLERVTP